MNYWNNRQIIERERLLDKTIAESEAELAKMYQQVAKRIVKEMTKLYAEIEADNETVLPSHLYQYNRYYKILSNLLTEMNKLSTKQVNYLDKKLTKLYKQNAKIVSMDLNISTDVNPDLVKRAVESYWVADGANWSSRIWKNNRLLAASLEQGLTDIISTGRGHKALSKELMTKFSQSFSNAERIVRTELAYIQIQSTIDKYKEAGLDKYRFLTAKDERTCEECGELDGKEFYIDDGLYGINLPPIHPNCRCTILGVINVRNR